VKFRRVSGPFIFFLIIVLADALALAYSEWFSDRPLLWAQMPDILKKSLIHVVTLQLISILFKKLRPSQVGLVLALIFLSLHIYVVWQLFTSKSPWIAEAVYPTLVLLCPIAALALRIPAPPIYGLVVMGFVGAVYYYLISGPLWERVAFQHAKNE